MPLNSSSVVGGVDTHQDIHVGPVIDKDGKVLSTKQFQTTKDGYCKMASWMNSFGDLSRTGIEQTGSYGAGLSRYFTSWGVPILEVTGPDRQLRHSKGKNDTIDAITAAQACLVGDRVSVAKDKGGTVEALRVLKTTRSSAIKAKRAALQQLHNTIVACPDTLRDQLRHLTRANLIRTCANFKPDKANFTDLTVATKISLKSIARRILDLSDEIVDLDQFIEPLVSQLAPNLIETKGFGPQSGPSMLICIGDNPNRFETEASFAMLCGVAPISASSGKVERFRLNHGGNRHCKFSTTYGSCWTNEN